MTFSIFKPTSGRTGSRLVLILVLATALASCRSGKEGAATQVSGKVTLPLSGALVYIYLEGDDLYGPPRMVSDATGDDGAFQVALRPGKYLAVVRKRATGESAGPVEIGDHRSEPVPFEVFAGAQRIERFLYLSDPRFANTGEAALLRVFLAFSISV